MELSVVEAVVLTPAMSYDEIIIARRSVCTTSNELKYSYHR